MLLIVMSSYKKCGMRTTDFSRLHNFELMMTLLSGTVATENGRHGRKRSWKKEIYKLSIR